MSKKNKLILVLAILACVVSSVYAQTTSPYSRYGYGILKDQAVGPSKGMGGISYGLRNSYSANPGNPASYSRVDSLTFLFDIGVTYNKSRLKDDSGSQSDDNGSLDYVTMLMPLSKRLGMSLGILPYSTVGYSFGSVATDNGVSYLRSFSGSGGLNQVYVGLGYDVPVEGLSVGANISYLLGSLKNTSAIPSIGAGSSSYYATYASSDLSVKSLKFDLGVQYEMSISKKDLLTLGAVYSPSIKASSAKYTYSQYLLASSTTAISENIETHSGQDAGIPATYGVGFTVAHNENVLVGADVTFKKWKGVKYPSLMGDGMTDDNRFNDSWKYNVGGEYMVNPYGRSFLQRIKLRGGLNYGNSYLNFKNSDGTDGYKQYGATVGFGIPLRDSQAFGNRVSYLNINFEYKKLKPQIKSMISEEYFGVSLNVNINELWFMQRKVY